MYGVTQQCTASCDQKGVDVAHFGHPIQVHMNKEKRFYNRETIPFIRISSF